MPAYGYDYQLIKAGRVKGLACRVCGENMDVKKSVYSGDSVMAIILGKSGIYDEFCCSHSGEAWHESALANVKDAEKIINERILNKINLHQSKN